MLGSEVVTEAVSIVFVFILILASAGVGCQTELEGSWYYLDCNDWQPCIGYPEEDCCCGGYYVELSFSENRFTVYENKGGYRDYGDCRDCWEDCSDGYDCYEECEEDCESDGYGITYSGRFEIDKDTVPKQLDLIIENAEYDCYGNYCDSSHLEERKEEVEAREGTTWLSGYILENGALKFVDEYNTEEYPDEGEIEDNGIVLTHEYPFKLLK